MLTLSVKERENSFDNLHQANLAHKLGRHACYASSFLHLHQVLLAFPSGVESTLHPFMHDDKEVKPFIEGTSDSFGVRDKQAKLNCKLNFSFLVTTPS